MHNIADYSGRLLSVSIIQWLLNTVRGKSQTTLVRNWWNVLLMLILELKNDQMSFTNVFYECFIFTCVYTQLPCGTKAT